MKCSVYIATSLDGFIARPDGGIDWLEAANQAVPPGEDFGYAAFMASVDALVMGRKTFELVTTFPQWPYGDKPVIVLSRTLRALPPGLPATVALSDERPAALTERLEKAGMKRLYIDGGRTIQSFLEAGLIDDLTITRIPVLIGAGIPLFGPLAQDIRFAHVSTQAWPFGFVQSVYRVKR